MVGLTNDTANGTGTYQQRISAAAGGYPLIIRYYSTSTLWKLLVDGAIQDAKVTVNETLRTFILPCRNINILCC